MITLETIIQDIQRISLEHLEEVGQLVQTLKAKEEANKRLAEETRRILQGIDDLPDEVWDDIMAYQRRVRAELFTRPNPFAEDEPDAA